MTDPLRIFIVDDQPLFRCGLRALLEAEPGLTVIGEAAHGSAAWAHLAILQPDIIVLDLTAPAALDLTLVRTLHQQHLTIALILFLRPEQADELIQPALPLGVKGFVLKTSSTSDIIIAIRTVSTGQVYFSQVRAERLWQRLAQPANPARPSVALARLTSTERRILLLVAEYKSSIEIAAILCLSPRTVDNYRSNICQKLGLRGNNALLKFALAHQAQLNAEQE